MISRFFCVLFGFSVLALGTCAQDAPSLAEVARQAREKRKAEQKDQPSSDEPARPVAAPESPSPTSPAAKGRTPVPRVTTFPASIEPAITPNLKANMATDPYGFRDYAAAVGELLDKENFAELDRLAAEVRTSKARFSGSSWKLHALYSGLGSPARGQAADEQDWTRHLARLKRWAAQQPGSLTARVALGSFYRWYAWKGRGDGYADSVSQESWGLFAERVQLERKVLDEAQRLPEKDPEWFYAMLYLLRDEGAEGEEEFALFQKAIVFEPEYFYYYSAFAEMLQPKWGGGEGEIERFARAAADRAGGKKGDILYFHIATSLNCGCDSDSEMNGMSWPRIKRGFAALEELHGTSMYNLNTMGYMAILAGDGSYASQIFSRIGGRWDKTIWRSQQYFEDSRSWAVETAGSDN